MKTLRKSTSCSAWLLLSAVILGASTGCALTSKGEAMTVRYFSPESAPPQTTSATVAPPVVKTSESQVATPEVRLGRLTSGPNLRERIAYRDGAYELGYYEDRRWTERPETFVRREVARSLFEQHGFKRVLSGVAPTLDVEVLAFDELRLPNEHAARVALKMVLSQDREVVLEETITVDVPVAGDASKGNFENVVAAMSQALQRASDQVATKTVSALASRPGTAAQR